MSSDEPDGAAQADCDNFSQMSCETIDSPPAKEINAWFDMDTDSDHSVMDVLAGREVIQIIAFLQLAEYFDLRQKHLSSQQDERVIKTIIQDNSSVQICQCNPKPKVSSQDQKNIFTSLRDSDSESSDGNNGRCRNCTLPLEKPFSLVEDRRDYFETEASQGWSIITKKKRVASSKTVKETMDFPKASDNFEGLTSDLSKGFGQLNLNDGEYATSGFSGIQVPKLKYDTLKEYCTEMCQKLHDEELANCPDNVQLALTHSHCKLEWSTEIDRRPKLFYVTVLMTPALTKKYQSQKMQVAERSPFFNGQGMILTLQGESPWYCGVAQFGMRRDEHKCRTTILELTIRTTIAYHQKCMTLSTFAGVYSGKQGLYSNVKT
ncbi:hypothetical protein OXX69_000764 [Metschnikowia pulcherrima]